MDKPIVEYAWKKNHEISLEWEGNNWKGAWENSLK